MDEKKKVFENRMRHALARQGYRLMKSRLRDECAIDFGRYYIVDPDRNSIVARGNFRMMIEDVDRWVNAPRGAR